uniref:EGF-like domain-containing protein n=1 Tax=Plectus sambesii TaxID=2011161 RepID=A0A914WVI9_9BILA
MAYPHQGGYRLSLWDSNGTFVRGIWPENIEDGFAGLSDQTVQRSDNVVFLEPCQSCILLTERQGMELDDVFQSCADVNIVDGQPQSSRERCSGAGEFVDGLCRCDHLRSGPICQFKDYCTADDDCLNGGQCVEEVHSLIRKTCFCAFGYFGINCQLSAAPHIVPGEALGDCFNRDYPKNEWKFDSYGLFKNSCYEIEQLNKEDVVYYRTLEDEIEIILDYRTTTWVGIGWRPIGIDSSCRLFPWGPDSSSELNETAHSLTIQLQL